MLFLCYNFLTFSTHLMVDDIECMWQIVGKLRDSDVAKMRVKSVGNFDSSSILFQSSLIDFYRIPTRLNHSYV